MEQLGGKRRLRGEGAFTLIEMLVVMVIASSLLGLSVTGWVHYQRSQDLRGSADELVSVLRNAQQSSYAEANSYCISFNTVNSTYTLYRSACTGVGSVQVGSPHTMKSGRISLSAPQFRQVDNSLAPSVTFDPRGTASKGSVKVVTSTSARKYTVSVEGLTGHVDSVGS